MIYEAMIVDDEAPARAELTAQLDDTARVKTVAEAVCLQEAIQRIRDHHFDIVFIDCNIAGAGSTLLTDALPTFDHEPLFVYMSAYSDYAPQPFGIEPIGRLTKPIDNDKLAELLDHIDDLWKAVRVQS